MSNTWRWAALAMFNKRMQPQWSCVGHAVLSLVLGCTGALAKPSQVWVDEGRLQTDRGAIPPACLARLMTRLNGDNVVAAIYLGRNSWRGCLDANDPFPQQQDSEISYQILAQPSNHRYAIRVCQSVDGSLKQFCNNILIDVVNRSYQRADGGVIPVLSLEKIGDVP